MENWLFPNVLLMRLGSNGIADNSEMDYLDRMREHSIDEVGSMHDHYDGFLGLGPNGEGLLNAKQPPPKLVALALSGVKSLRIPIGYWSLEAPTQDVRVLGGHFAHDYERPGVSPEGFVTGAATYLRAAAKWIRVLNMTAVVDMHSLPGGAVRNMGYTGKYFPSAEAFDGADEWAKDGNTSSLPLEPHYLRRSVQALLKLANLLRSFDDAEETRGVIAGMAPYNEALFADDAKARGLLAPFTLKMVPLLRAILPASRYQIWLNFFNNGLDWPVWMSEHASVLGDNVLADIHVYHAFDPPFDLAKPFEQRGCPMCTPGPSGMRSLVCKTCYGDRAVIERFTSRGLRVVVGEWSLGTCAMWGAHPSTISDPDFLYAFFASARSTFAGAGAEADFFWTAIVPTGGYDPTRYAKDKDGGGSIGIGTRASVLRRLEKMAEEDDVWITNNAYVAPPGPEGVEASYLLNWHYIALSATNTSNGHPVILPRMEVRRPRVVGGGEGAGSSSDAAAAEGGGAEPAREGKEAAARQGEPASPPSASSNLAVRQPTLIVDGVCNFTPAAPRRIMQAATEGSCDLCDTTRRLELGAALVLLLLLGAAVWRLRAWWLARKGGKLGHGEGQPAPHSSTVVLSEPLIVKTP